MLDGNPDLVARAHRDWARLLSSSPEGRAGYPSEQLLRALLVMFLEGDSYRDVVIRIDTSEFLRHFVRLGFKATMDFTFLNRAFGVLSAETLVALNQGVAL
ncbi:MAG: transposase [Phycisphaerae bacterium]|nr:transposase [Phycisphaerae bacterium]